MNKKAAFPNVYLFFIILSFYYLMLFYITHYILTDNLFYNSYSSFLNTQRISEMLTQQKKMQYTQYMFFLFYLFSKVFFTSVCIYTWSFFKEMQIKWKDIFNISLTCEIVFAIEMLIKIIYFSVYTPDKIDSISNFSPFSIKRFLPSSTPQYLNYVCQTLNVYELIYILLLAQMLKEHTHKKFVQNVLIVFRSYGLGLLCWVVTVTFLLLQFF